MIAIRFLLPLLLLVASGCSDFLPEPKAPPAPADAAEENEWEDEEVAVELETLEVTDLRRIVQTSGELRERTRAARLLATRAPETAGLARALAEGLDLASISETEKTKKALLSLGPGAARAVPALERIVTAGDEADLRDALDVLGRISDPSARDVVLATLRGDHGPVARRAALEHAGRSDARIEDVLRRILSSPDPILRLLAARALSRVDPPPGLPAALEALAGVAGDGSPETAGFALVALIRADAAPAGAGARLGEWMKDPSIRSLSRREWAAGLVRGGPEAVVALERAVNPPDEPGLAAFEARRSLWRRGAPIDPMLEAMAHLLVHGTLGARVELSEIARELGPAAAPLAARLREIAASKTDPPFLADHAREALDALR